MDWYTHIALGRLKSQLLFARMVAQEVPMVKKRKRKRVNPPDDTRRNRLKTRHDIRVLDAKFTTLQLRFLQVLKQVQRLVTIVEKLRRDVRAQARRKA